MVGWDYNPGNYEWRVEKRSKPQGDLLSATGMGRVTFTVNNGSFAGLSGVEPCDGVSPLPPAGLTFPYGLFNCTIGNLTAGCVCECDGRVACSVACWAVLMYWTFLNGVWRQLPSNHLTVRRESYPIRVECDGWCPLG